MSDRNQFSTAMIKTDNFLKNIGGFDGKNNNQILAHLIASDIILNKKDDNKSNEILAILEIKYKINVKKMIKGQL